MACLPLANWLNGSVPTLDARMNLIWSFPKRLRDYALEKKHANSLAQNLADNLNRNVMLDHIEYVEKGIRPKDADYFKFLKIKDNLVSLEQFQKWKYSKKIKKMSLF